MLTFAVASGVVGCSDDDKTGVIDLARQGKGTCLVAAPNLGPEVAGIPTVPCTEEHTHELYAVVPYDDGDVFPGQDALDSFAERVCVAEFQLYVGVSVFDSTLTFSWLVPTLASWNNNADKNILCVVGPFDSSTLSVSVQNSRL